MPKRVVLCSGGLDSTILAHWVANGYSTLSLAFIDYGQKNADKEWESVQKVATNLSCDVIRYEAWDLFEYCQSAILKNCDMSMSVDNAELPSRNLVLCSYLSAIYASHDTILYVGAHKTAAPYPDCTPKFYKKLDKLLKLSTKGKVSVVAPFINMTKQQIVDLAYNNGMTPQQLWDTVSCYYGNRCGLCPACLARKQLNFKGLPI